MAYLDDTGLAHFWDKIKQWIASAASNLVHRTGDETVAGVKTFDRVKVDGSQWVPLYMKVADDFDTSVPTYPAVNSYAGVEFTDGSGHATGSMYQNFTTSGTRVLRFRNTADNGVALSYLEIGYDPSTGEQWASCPSTLASRSSYGGDIVTRNWIPQDTRIVHTTGAESISGIKSFNSKVNVETNEWLPVQLRLPNVNHRSSAYPSTTVYTGIGILDAGDHYPGDFYYAFNPDGSRQWVLRLIKDDGVATSGFRVNYIPGESDCYATIPTAALTEDSTRMPNTYWVRRATGNFACNAATATKLATARTVRTNLASTSTASFDGSANITPGVTGTLPVANGGTGLTSLATFVRTTGDQTVSDTKLYDGFINMERANPYIYFTETDIDKGSVPSSTGYQGLIFRDKDKDEGGTFMYHYSTEKTSYFTLSAKNMSSSSASGSTELYIAYASNGTKSVSPDGNGAVLLGKSGNRWKEIWCTQSSINSPSDRRLKQAMEPVPSEVLDAWGDAEWVQYKFNDSVAEKGFGAARLHTGMIAQDLDEAFRGHGLDAGRYGLFLYDEWPEIPEERDAEGNVVVSHEPAGDAYGLRYVEALCMEAAYMRRENARLKKRVADLEERLAALELRLGSE